METFIVFAASYDTLGAAEVDYYAVRDLYLTSGRLDSCEAAVISRDDAGHVTIVKHELPTHQDAWLVRVGAALVALFPATSGPGVSLQEAVAESEAAVREAEREVEAAERAAEQYSTFGSSSAPRDDLASQLDDLARLRGKGALSEAEFEAAKSRLLGG